MEKNRVRKGIVVGARESSPRVVLSGFWLFALEALSRSLNLTADGLYVVLTSRTCMKHSGVCQQQWRSSELRNRTDKRAREHTLILQSLAS